MHHLCRPNVAWEVPNIERDQKIRMNRNLSYMQIVWISDLQLRECGPDVNFDRKRKRFIQKSPNFIGHDWRNLHSH